MHFADCDDWLSSSRERDGSGSRRSLVSLSSFGDLKMPSSMLWVEVLWRTGFKWCASSHQIERSLRCFEIIIVDQASSSDFSIRDSDHHTEPNTRQCLWANVSRHSGRQFSGLERNRIHLNIWILPSPLIGSPPVMSWTARTGRERLGSPN